MRTVFYIVWGGVGLVVLVAAAFGGVVAWQLARAPSPPLVIFPSPVASPSPPPSPSPAASPSPPPGPTPPAPPRAPPIGPAHVWRPTREQTDEMFRKCVLIGGVARDERCVADFMVAAGASPEAISFWKEYGAILAYFEETGQVDFGIIWSPFFDMARPHPVFLNSIPPVLIVGLPGFLATPESGTPDFHSGEAPSTFNAFGRLDPAKELVTQDLILWPQYGRLLSVTSSPSGQTFVVRIPMKRCRACETEREVDIAFTFDQEGRYVDRRLEP